MLIDILKTVDESTVEVKEYQLRLLFFTQFSFVNNSKAAHVEHLE